jgi:nicotinamide mononucleotide (NMN) deamidase PncC
VGLVYIAIAGAAGTVVKRNRFIGNRLQIKDLSVDMALRMLLEYLG